MEINEDIEKENKIKLLQEEEPKEKVEENKIVNLSDERLPNEHSEIAEFEEIFRQEKTSDNNKIVGCFLVFIISIVSIVLAVYFLLIFIGKHLPGYPG